MGNRKTHAPSTPVTVCPVIRHLTDLSQKGFTPLVLATPDFLTTRHRWVYFRSSFGRTPARGRAPSFCSNAHHLGPWTKAAWSGLRPAPESRSRGARPHLPRSFTTPSPPPFVASLQHTVPEELEPVSYVHDAGLLRMQADAEFFLQECFRQRQRGFGFLMTTSTVFEGGSGRFDRVG